MGYRKTLACTAARFPVAPFRTCSMRGRRMMSNSKYDAWLKDRLANSQWAKEWAAKYDGAMIPTGYLMLEEHMEGLRAKRLQKEARLRKASRSSNPMPP